MPFTPVSVYLFRPTAIHMATSTKLLELKGISKCFASVQALDRVDFDLDAGEVHCLVGENGAGKSTLIKVVASVVIADTGTIYFAGDEMKFSSPLDSQNAGINVVHQELALCPEFSIAENIFLGHWELKGPFINWPETRRHAADAIRMLGMSHDVMKPVRELSSIDRRLIGIARAVAFDAKVFIFDEPTAALSNRGKDQLFETIQKLKDQGKGIIYISHHLDEIFEIGDRVTILRDGKLICSVPLIETNHDEVIQNMIGRDIQHLYPDRGVSNPGETLFEVDRLSRSGVFQNVSFQLKKGEILGIAGLVGSGRTELLNSIFGVDPYDHGEIRWKGEKVEFASPSDAISCGIGFVTEDRLTEGLVLQFKVKENISMSSLQAICRAGFLVERREVDLAEEYIDKLNIDAGSAYETVSHLSGGNQQKVVLAKWLARDCDLLMFDEPTKGVDVGAREQIYELLFQLARSGKAIIIVSSEFPELEALSDRIVILKRGVLSGELGRDEASHEKLLSMV
jgi:ABC-type sugar transport system ATPase subunit